MNNKLVLRRLATGLQVGRALILIKFFKKRIPLYCEWEVTDYCNMDCDFCSTLSPTRNSANWDTRPSEALRIIDQLAELGTKFIHFSGGEPTLRKDLRDLIARAKENGMIVALTTNGYGSPSIYSSVLKADVIRISIDGVGAYHDKIRSKKNSYNRAIKVIKFLLDNQTRPAINMTISDDTPDDQINNLIGVAEKLGVEIHLSPMGRKWSEDSTPEQMGIVKRIRHFHSIHKRVVANPNPFLSVLEIGGLDKYGCRAMDVAISIKADGSVHLPCTGMDYRAKGNISQIFYGEEADELRLMQGRHSVCQGCSIRCMITASSLLKASGLQSIFQTYARNVLH